MKKITLRLDFDDANFCPICGQKIEKDEMFYPE